MPDEVRTSSGNAEDHLIRDLAYEIVERDAFKAMVDIDHYDRRSHDFDQPIDMDKEIPDVAGANSRIERFGTRLA